MTRRAFGQSLQIPGNLPAMEISYLAKITKEGDRFFFEFPSLHLEEQDFEHSENYQEACQKVQNWVKSNRKLISKKSSLYLREGKKTRRLKLQ